MPPARALRKRPAETEAVASRPKRANACVDGTGKEQGKDDVVVPRKPTLFDDLDGSPVKTSTNGSSNIEYLQSLDGDDDDDDSVLSDLDDADFEEPQPKSSARKPAKELKGKAKAQPKPKPKPKAKPKPPIERAPKDGIVPRKPTLFDDLDVSPAALAKSKTKTSNIDYLASLDGDDDDSDGNSNSSLSDMDVDMDFEDVPLQKNAEDAEDAEIAEKEEDSDSDEFEDVVAEPAPFSFLSMAIDHDAEGQDDAGQNLELTLIKDTRVSLTTLHAADSKKGPSKMERLVRSATHCVHVQSLLFHNALRNAWMCDGEVQGLLLSRLPAKLWDEVERWQRLSGTVTDEAAPKDKGKGKAKGKGKEKAVAGSSKTKRKTDWSAATRVAPTAADLGHSDPILRLLRVLAAWWRQVFTVTAPGLRKTGYMTLERLDRFLKAAKDARGVSTATHVFGERIRHVRDMRACAAQLQGSRDVGAQLFTALLRAVGVEARMVASLQPLGFGWNKLEDADDEVEEADAAAPTPAATPSKASTPKASTPMSVKSTKPTKSTAKRSTIVIDSDDELDEVNSDNDAVVFDLPPASAAKTCQYDQDLPYAVYWTEVQSPVQHTWIPVDAVVKHVVATNRELIESSFEPRGGKAEKARQVMGYVVGYAADGTAKDVMVRYLKRQMLPGRTRGVRFPVEKMPVYDKHGKVRRYDVVDWFRQSVMRGYARGFSAAYAVTEADEAEDSTDLKPAQPEKKPVKAGDETLQYYKQSAEFVLERHLKREEALVRGAVVARHFVNPKQKKSSGDDAGEKVYLRKDVVAVKSAETWHKQGRAPKAGEMPLKQVPYRAATLNRKREIAEAEAATGSKVLQGLYAQAQTEWIIPAPIRDGVIPKNAYGNIDLFAAHMCPQGAVHVPFRGTPRVCRKLGIDFAEAVVDFEFGHRMAVPVIQGVVVAEAHQADVLRQLEKDEAERARKEDAKRRGKAMGMWRKMLMGLRVVERIRHEYGDVREVIDLEGGDGAAEGKAEAEEAGKGLPHGYEYEDEEEQQSRFFPVDDDDDDIGGGFVIE